LKYLDNYDSGQDCSLGKRQLEGPQHHQEKGLPRIEQLLASVVFHSPPVTSSRGLLEFNTHLVGCITGRFFPFGLGPSLATSQHLNLREPCRDA